MISVASLTALSIHRSAMETPQSTPQRPRTFSPLVLFNDFAAAAPAPPPALFSKEKSSIKPCRAKEDYGMDLDRPATAAQNEDVVMGDGNGAGSDQKHATTLHAHQRASRPPSPSSSPAPLDEVHQSKPTNTNGCCQAMEIEPAKYSATTTPPPSSYASSSSSSMEALAQTLVSCSNNSQQQQQQHLQMQRKKIQHMLDQNSLLWWELVRYTRTVERVQRERGLESEPAEGEKHCRRRTVTQGVSNTPLSPTYERSQPYRDPAQVGSNSYTARRLGSSTAGPMDISPPELSPTEAGGDARGPRSPRSPSPVPLARPQPTYPPRTTSPPPRQQRLSYRSEAPVAVAYEDRFSAAQPEMVSHYYHHQQRLYPKDSMARPGHHDDRQEAVRPRQGGGGEEEEHPLTTEYAHGYTATTAGPRFASLQGRNSSSSGTGRYSPSLRPRMEDTMATPRPPYQHQHHHQHQHQRHPSAVRSEHSSKRSSPYGSPYRDESAPGLKHEARLADYQQHQHQHQHQHQQHHPSPYPPSRDGSEGQRSSPQSPSLRLHPSPSPSLHSGSRPPRDDHSPHYHGSEQHLHRSQQQQQQQQHQQHVYRTNAPQPPSHHQQQQQPSPTTTTITTTAAGGGGGAQAGHGQSSQQGGRKRRGNLPKAVTMVLKAWLVENAKHPYPTEEEKIKLSQETGLTLNQISNWFINARRRILQPILVEAAAAAVAGTDEPMDQVTIVRKGKGSRMLVEVEGGHYSQQQQQQQQQQHSPQGSPSQHNLSETDS